MALDTQVPQWLVQQNMWEQEDASRSTQQLVQSWFQGQQLGIEKQKAQQQMAQGMLSMQQQKQALDLGKIKLNNYAADSTTIPEWLKEHPTWDSRQDAQWPTALTPEGESQLAQVRMRDAQSIQQKAAVAAVGDFAKRVDKLSAVDPASAGQFAPYIGKANPSPTILQALSVAEQAAAQSKQNTVDQTTTDALARGDVPTTTVGPKGVSTTYKPAAKNPNLSVFKPEEPIVLQDGGKMLHVSPNKWQYVKGNSSMDMSTEQKRNVAHELLSIDPKDPRGLNILDELATMAMPKNNNGASAPSPTSNTDPLGILGK